jgi:hypothetical protein
MKSCGLKITLVLGVLVSISSAYAGKKPPPRVPIDIVTRCGELVSQAQLEMDPRAIQATLFHALALDYNILFDEKGLYYMVEALNSEFSLQITEYGGGAPSHYNGFRTRGRGELIKLVQGLRVSESSYKTQIDNAILRIWHNIKNDFLNRPPLQQFGTYSMPNEKFADVAQLLQVIEAEKVLKDAVFSVIRTELLNTDRWIDIAASGMPASEAAFLAIADLAVPAGVTAPGGGKLEPLVTVDLEKMNTLFTAPVDPAILTTHDGVLRFDQDLRKNVYNLSNSSVSLYDRFLRHPVWDRVFESTAAWIFAGERAVTEHKTQFMVMFSQVQGLLEIQTINVRKELYTIALARSQTVEHIHILETQIKGGESSAPVAVQSIIAADEEVTLRRLEATLAELDQLSGKIELSTTRMRAAQLSLGRLREEALKASPVVKDPEVLKRELTQIQIDLDIDPLLLKRLEKKKRFGWFWL